MIAVDNRAVENIDISNIDDNIKDDLKDNNSIDVKDTEIFKTEASEIKPEDLNFRDIINGWDQIGAETWSTQEENIGGNNYNTIRMNIIDGCPYWDYGGSINCLCYYKEPQKYRGDPVNINRPQYYSNWKSFGFPFGTGATYTTALLNPNSFNTNKLKMVLDVEPNGNLQSGVMFNVQRNGTKLSGYFFNLVNHSVGQYDYANPKTTGNFTYKLNFWRFDNMDFDYTPYLTFFAHTGCGEDTHPLNTTYTLSDGSGITKIAGYTMSRRPGEMNTWALDVDKGKVKLTLKENGIERTILDKTLTEYIEGSYGFWGINCERSASFTLTKVNITEEKSKNYGDILLNQKWRDNSIRNITNINNKIEPSFNTPQVISNVLNNDINTITWGSIENKDYIEDFINHVEGNGAITYYRKEDFIGP